MSYKNQPPVKQVWLPIDGDFIDDHKNETFAVFSKNYKDEYGIDLHDLFELASDVDDAGSFGVHVKGNVCIGAYNATKKSHGNTYSFYPANPYAIGVFNYIEQSEDIEHLLSIDLTGLNREVGLGFFISLPATGTTVESIDDLLIGLHDF